MIGINSNPGLTATVAPLLGKAENAAAAGSATTALVPAGTNSLDTFVKSDAVKKAAETTKNSGLVEKFKSLSKSKKGLIIGGAAALLATGAGFVINKVSQAKSQSEDNTLAAY